MTEREALMRKITSAAFAAWELHIYLDTHPYDTEAIANMKKYESKADILIKEYESKYGPISAASSLGEQRFAWVNDAWPWELEG